MSFIMDSNCVAPLSILSIYPPVGVYRVSKNFLLLSKKWKTFFDPLQSSRGRLFCFVYPIQFTVEVFCVGNTTTILIMLSRQKAISKCEKTLSQAAAFFLCMKSPPNVWEVHFGFVELTPIKAPSTSLPPIILSFIKMQQA